MRLVVAVPCHRDEPGVGGTVRQLLDQSATFGESRVVVCVNGPEAAASPAASLLKRLQETEPRLEVLLQDRPSKAAAWNRLRSEPADVTVFCDADVELGRGAIAALVSALENDSPAVLATASQQPNSVRGLVGKVATVPFRLRWGGVAGTLYAARTAWLPEMPEDVLLDDAWLWSQAARHGQYSVVKVDEAVAAFEPPRRWRDLWRQRLRAEAGKRQLAHWGLPLAPQPEGGAPGLATLRAYAPSDWPAVATLAAVKIAASVWSRLRAPRWLPAASTKPLGEEQAAAGQDELEQ